MTPLRQFERPYQPPPAWLRSWSQRQALPVLALFDDGLRLYRQHAPRFVLITTLGMVPLALALRIVARAAAWFDPAWALWLRLVLLPCCVALIVFVVGSLSLAASRALDREPLVLGKLLLGPLRVVAASVASLSYAIVAQGFYILIALSLGILLATIFFVIQQIVLQLPFGGALLLDLLVLSAVASIYLALTAAFGVPYVSVIYALQPWFHEQHSFRAQRLRSRALRLAQFGDDFTIFFWAALLTSLVALSLIASLELLVRLLVSDPALLRTITRIGWIVIAIVLLPPLPIWMTLVYRRVVAMYDGGELAARIAAWQPQEIGATP
jgi:hypothetical protein